MATNTRNRFDSNVRPIHPRTLRRIFGDVDPEALRPFDGDATHFFATHRVAPQRTSAELMVEYFRHNGGRLIFGTVCFTFGMLFADAIIYVLTVLS